MSTAIATVNEKIVDYPALAPDSRQARIMLSNLDGERMTELDLVKVTTPLGGSTVWNIDMDGNVESSEEIVGLLVAEAKRGVLWPSSNPSEQRPIIVTNDLIVGYRVSDDIGSEIDPEVLEKFRIGDRRYDWAALSTSQAFGFGSSGAGKRVKETRVLAILRREQPDKPYGLWHSFDVQGEVRVLMEPVANRCLLAENSGEGYWWVRIFQNNNWEKARRKELP